MSSLAQSSVWPAFDQPVSRCRSKLPWVLNLLLLYLAGITIFGKGPTYLAAGPVFWGEVVLLLSFLWALTNWRRVVLRTFTSRVLTSLICCFIALGAIETGIDYQKWGIDTLRDSAIWYYSLFYFIGVAIASSSEESGIFCSRWKLLWIVAIIWGSAELFSGSRLSELSPLIPGRQPVFSGSGSDTAQSVGLGCLLLLGEGWRSRWLGTLPRITLAAVGLAAAITYPGRGARLAVLAAFVVVAAVSVARRSSGQKVRQRLSILVLVIVAGTVGAMASGVNIAGAFSLERFQGASFENPDETVEWRTIWWQRLYEVVMTQDPVFGLGFGENLADYNPYISQQDSLFPVRSPHNFNVTVFARMGIAGSLIWGGIIVLGILLPLWRVLSASTRLQLADTRTRSFLIAAVIATWVNASFGVLMEGPVLAIPFWLILGLLAGFPNVNLIPKKLAIR